MAEAPDGKVLIVRHGKGRGRLPNYMGECLDFYRRYRPKLHERLMFHETGTAAPSLDGIAAVLFWLGDPLREMYPDCHADAKRIDDAALARGLRRVNPPDALSNTIKTRQSQLWRDAGLPTPEALPFSTLDELGELYAKLGPAVMLRPSHSHAQTGIKICRSLDAVLEAARTLLPAPALIAPLVDLRAGWKEKDAGNLFGQLFHCKRAYVFGPVVHPMHIQFASQPVVAGPYSTFNAERRKRLKLPASPLPGSWDAFCVASDYAFGTGPAEDPALMRRAGEALGLEYYAVDYATRADGSHVLWEVNPFLLVPLARNALLPQERRIAMRYPMIFDALGRFLQQLANGAARA